MNRGYGILLGHNDHINIIFIKFEQAEAPSFFEILSIRQFGSILTMNLEKFHDEISQKPMFVSYQLYSGG